MLGITKTKAEATAGAPATGGLHAEQHRLEALLSDLVAEQHRAEEEHATLERELALAQEGILNGHPLEDAERVQGRLDTIGRRLGNVRTAIEEANRRLHAVAVQVDAEVRKEEAARQELKAAPLREEADAKVRAIVGSLAAAYRLLRERKALGEILASELPLATQLGPLALRDLAGMAKDTYSGPVDVHWNDAAVRDKELLERHVRRLSQFLVSPLLVERQNDAEAFAELGIAR